MSCRRKQGRKEAMNFRVELTRCGFRGLNTTLLRTPLETKNSVFRNPRHFLMYSLWKGSGSEKPSAGREVAEGSWEYSLRSAVRGSSKIAPAYCSGSCGNQERRLSQGLTAPCRGIYLRGSSSHPFVFGRHPKGDAGEWCLGLASYRSSILKISRGTRKQGVDARRRKHQPLLICTLSDPNHTSA